MATLWTFLYNNDYIVMTDVGGDDKIVQCLLEYNAKVNIVDQNNQTPLMKAIEGGHLECVKLLLNYRADLTVRDKYGNAPIHQAVKFGRKDIIELFLRSGVSINTHNQNGLTPLHLAVEKHNLPLLQFLVQEGAEVDCTDINGRTALMMACESGDAPMTEMLINFGANLDICNNDGRIPSTKGARLEARPDFKRPSNSERLFGNENTASDSGSGDEDTGDDILEGVFESSDEESKDRGGTLSPVARRTHSSDEAVLKRANCTYDTTLPARSPTCLTTLKETMQSSVDTLGREKSKLPITLMTETASMQEDSWNSDSSEAKGEGGRKKVNLAAALSAKLAKQAKTETEVVVSPSPNRPVEDAESWVDDVSTHRKVGSPTDKPRGSSQSESSPWDSEAEDNEVREANEVSVSTLTQVSESSDKDLSIMEEFSKVPVPFGIDHPLGEAANRAVTSNTQMIQKEENQVRLTSTRDLSPVDEQSDETFSTASKKTAMSDQEGKQTSKNHPIQSFIKWSSSEPLHANSSQLKKTDQEKSGNVTELTTSESDKTMSIPVLPDHSPMPSLSQTLSRSVYMQPKVSLASPPHSEIDPTSPQPRRSRSRSGKETAQSRHMLSPSALPTEVAECSVSRDEVLETSEAESLQYQLMQSIEALDREESAQKALEEELNVAREELLTSTIAYREGSCQAAAQSSQDFAELLAKTKHLQANLAEESNHRRRLESLKQAMISQLAEKDEELSRIHSTCQDLVAELQHVKTDLRAAVNAKFQMQTKFEEDMRILKQKAVKEPQDHSTSPTFQLQDEFKTSREKATQFATGNTLTSRLVMKAQVELSRIRSDLIDSKIEVQNDMSAIRNDLTRLQNVFLRRIIMTSKNSQLRFLEEENERLRSAKRDLELLHEEGIAKYEEKMALIQEESLSLRNLESKNVELLSENKTLRCDLSAQCEKVELLEESMKGLESTLRKEKDAVKNLKQDLIRAGDKHSETTALLMESRRREKDACKWVTRLLKSIKSLEQSSQALHAHLKVVFFTKTTDEAPQSKTLSVEEVTTIVELIDALDLVQDDAKTCVTEARCAIPDLESVERETAEIDAQAFRMAILPPNLDHSRSVEKYLVERILQAKNSEWSARQIVEQQKQEISRLNALNASTNKTRTVATNTEYSSDVDSPNLQIAPRTITAKTSSPIGSFDNVFRGRHFASSVALPCFQCHDAEPQMKRLTWVANNTITDRSTALCAPLEASRTDQLAFDQLQEENERLQKQLAHFKSRKKTENRHGRRSSGGESSEVESDSKARRKTFRQSSRCCRTNFHEADDVPTCEKLQRRIHELELERNRILVEKQVLEENARAEHRLADKLITQTLRRRRTRYSSIRHYSGRRDRRTRNSTESSYASETSTERHAKRRKSHRKKASKSTPKASEDGSSENEEINVVPIGDLQPHKPTIRQKVSLLVGDSYADKMNTKELHSKKVFGVPSVTSLMLQKARLNLQAVERDLQAHTATPDINSSDYLEYLKKKYLM
ncbi:Ankyrin repeat domain containing protein [Echinococcus multilocularis]|uniref:Ankyrin repeat domain containing protein n=1 Tax=Echinococcus multilocularis TaxID=6211 RepID=A0A068Y9U4_ECHMU|nr:Ankyrin repeat domain containing protein [Echinococcus multilocularis]